MTATPDSRRPPARWRLRALAAALFGAACVGAAQPPLDLALPALVAWGPALVLARRVDWRRRFRLGWLLGFGYQVILFFFLAPTTVNMTGLPYAAGLGVVALYAAWHGLIGGLFLALAEPARRAAERRRPWLGPLAVAATFTAVEAAWPQVFTVTVGHGLWEIGPVHALAALTGVPGLSFVALLVSAGGADAWVHRSARRLGPSAATLLALLGFAVAWHLHATAAGPARTLEVAIVQPNYTLEEKQRASGRVDPGESAAQRARMLERFEQMLRALPADRYDLVVASEGSFPVLWDVHADERPADEPATATRLTRRIQAAVAEGPRAHAIIGGLRRGRDGKTRNAAVHLGPDGRILSHYDKQTLMPFGEYMPGRDLFPQLARAVPGVSDFYPGDRPCAFDVDGVRVACGVCYETIFAEDTRADAAGADLLVNLTIDTWFGDTNAPEAHLMIQASRAAELGVPLVRAALSGVSAVVDADGVARRRLPLDQAGVLEADVALRDLCPPYRAVGPAFAWLCAALALGLLADAFARRRELSSEAGVPPAPPPTQGAGTEADPDDHGRPDP